VRKILTILAALVAVVALSGVASADVPNPTYTADHSPGQDLGQTCSTPWDTGVFGQYGAQGFYIDGCTARVTCPSYARWCSVHGTGTIADFNYATDSMNARLRMFDSHGSLIGFKDTSCPNGGGYRGCTTPRLDGTLGPNGTATVQCNGVRRINTPGYAKDTCRVELFENFVS
jgi:hypothetical protein